MQPFATGVQGARIWLSGSVPVAEESTAQQRESIEAFIVRFARAIFRSGGHIVHGAHPTVVPLLLREAQHHQHSGGRKDCLTIAISRFWSKDREREVDEWRKTALVSEVQEGHDQDESLRLLRYWLAARVDAAVVVGGRWWDINRVQAGIPAEIVLAVERGLPVFLAGGLGGAAHGFLMANPALLRLLKNGLSEEENKRLSLSDDVASISTEVVAQLERLPLVRGAASEGATFRILSLDGGGIKGTFAAAVIASWEQLTGLRVVDHFDLVAGTSTGGILALGLGAGLSGEAMLKFYRRKGPQIFPVTSLRSRFLHALRHAVRPKYSQHILFTALEEGLYDGGAVKRMKDARTRLVIPSYHALAGSPHVFRTPHHPDVAGDAETPLACVALATAAAPTYFASARIKNAIAETSFVDGGVWANNPSLAAMIEAVTYLRIPLERIDLLSIGTTEEPFTIKSVGKSGLFGWSTKLVKLLLSAQEDAATEHARLLASEPRFIRINTMTAPGAYSLDGVRDIEELASLGNRAAMEPTVLSQVRSRFLNGVKTSPW